MSDQPLDVPKLLEAIKSANIQEDAWHWDLIENNNAIPEWDRGYMTAKIEGLTNSLYSNSEDYRDEIYHLVKNQLEE